MDGRRPRGAEGESSIPRASGTRPETGEYDVAAIMGGLYGDGIIALKGAFSREWVDALEPIVQAHSIEGLMMGEA